MVYILYVITLKKLYLKQMVALQCTYFMWFPKCEATAILRGSVWDILQIAER